MKLQDVYEVLLKDYGKYAKVAKSAVKKMKRIEEDHKSTLAQLMDAKCEVEDFKEELLKLMLKWSASQPKSLIMFFLLKSLSQTKSN